ncbi:MAG: hypothetical protein HY868_03950 [Chloroflexi bacterium]|nr:hypothetical protein [Chloroflexota bacterium]
MPTRLAYLDDPLTLEFTAHITGKTVLPDGRRAVVLDATYFYPTGGGQEHDTGTLGDARVTDVVTNDAGDVLHIVDREVNGDALPARIDRARRFAFIQHHSGQHLLSQAFEHELDLETVAVNINIDSASTLDLNTNAISAENLARVENFANVIIYQDRAIKSYWVSEANITSVPLRRPPKVTGQIRIVEIDQLDYSACGGTHCPRTGMIGVLKILKTERRNDKTRIYFAAGTRALEFFQQYQTIVTQVGLSFSTGPEGIVAALERQRDELRAAQTALAQFEEARLHNHTRELIAHAESLDALNLIVADEGERAAQAVRAIASALQNEPGIVAVLVTRAGGKLGVAVACAADTGVNANALIRALLADIAGRGGGDAKLAQGGGAASEEQIRALLASVKTRVAELRQRPDLPGF